jgi:hypothetical protein
MQNTTYLKLNNGNLMPSIAYGLGTTWFVRDEK